VDTYLAVASKRDWRSYADRPVPEDVQRRIVDAGRLSGSSVNTQPWTFVVVESAELTGMDAFEEVVNVEDIARLPDPLKERLLEIVRLQTPERV